MNIFDKYDLVDIDAAIVVPEMPAHGLVVVIGASGSGKTSILKKWGMNEQKTCLKTPIYKLFSSEAVAEHFLISAGLRSVPCWKRSLSSVSKGEQHRAEIAVSMSNGGLFIDEFTSLVDRNTARALCESINKSNQNSLVLATCHRDVLNWLDFDHAYDADLNEWINRGSLRRDKHIKLSIIPCDQEKIWPVFKKHHYLSGKINKSANCWGAFYKDKIVAMSSVIAFPSGNWSNGWRGHRTVVLPEFQGLGIGSALSDTIARSIVQTGARFFSKTSHPAFGMHRENSSNWRATSKNKKIRLDYKLGNSTKEDGHKMSHAHRLCFSHEYIL